MKKQTKKPQSLFIDINKKGMPKNSRWLGKDIKANPSVLIEFEVMEWNPSETRMKIKALTPREQILWVEVDSFTQAITELEPLNA